MKRIITLLAVIAMFGFQGCTGPEGPPGPPGYDGQDGLIGTVYENQAPNYYNFMEGNNFRVRFTFPETIYDSDVVLVYRLGDVVNGNALWEFLPETHYFDDEAGIRDFTYNYNFTMNYVTIFLEGYDFANPIPDAYTLNQIFRIVVVPAAFAATVDKANYLEVMSKLNLNENQIHDIKM